MYHTPDDKAAIDKIVDSITSDKSADTAPRLIVIGGGMQTGQSVLQRMMVDEGFIDKANTIVINPASFITMPGFETQKHVQHPEKTRALVDMYQHIVTQAIEAAIKNKSSILLVDHAEDKNFTLAIQKACAAAGYETLLAGVSSEASSYVAYANYTQDVQNRAADHPRGFRFLRDFARHFDEYAKNFGTTALFESSFSVKDGAADIAVTKVAEYRDGRIKELNDSTALERFYKRAHLNTECLTAEDAVKDVPKTIDCLAGQKAGVFDKAEGLCAAFNQFCAKDFSPRAAQTFQKIMSKRKDGPK